MQVNPKSQAKRWRVKIPFQIPGAKRSVFKFTVEARNREQARTVAIAVIRKKLPIEPNLLELKMVRV